MTYHKVDDIIQLIKQKGVECLLFKTDIQRVFSAPLHTIYVPLPYSLTKIQLLRIKCASDSSESTHQFKRVSNKVCERFTRVYTSIKKVSYKVCDLLAEVYTSIKSQGFAPIWYVRQRSLHVDKKDRFRIKIVSRDSTACAHIILNPHIAHTFLQALNRFVSELR